MPFREKSAWIMSLGLLLGGTIYFGVVIAKTVQLGELVSPRLPLVVIFSIVLVLVAIIGHALAAALAPKDAAAGIDERERRIITLAGHLSAYIFGFGVVMSLGWYLFSYNGDLLFYGVFASLMLGQLAEYVVQIFLYRTRI